MGQNRIIKPGGLYPVPRRWFANDPPIALPGFQVVEGGHTPRKTIPELPVAGRRLDQLAILHFAQGSGQWRSGGDSGMLMGPAIWVIPAGILHWYDPIPPGWFEERFLLCSGKIVDDVLASAGPLPIGPVPIAENHPCLLSWDRILMLAADLSPLARMAMAACALDLVTTVLIKMVSSPPQKDAIEDYQAVVHQTITAYLSPLTIFLDSRGLLADTFRRQFTARIGQPPHAWRNQLRLGLARSMLEDQHMTPKQVAERLGFTDLHWFGRWLKGGVGTSSRALNRDARDS